ncbi:MAG TPA: hypothetical protein VLH41_09110, partial [Thermoanaerobaculia bacterium]|nr:hypothetical protein [Thermoanaerobaculia bacterium]
MRAVAAAPVDVIAPFAGSGVRGVSGDGGPATAARLNGAQGLGVAVDPASGDVYISDTANCRVRKVSGGIITTIAGNGVCAYGGDGGPATSASLNFPLGLAVDGAGSLFIADVFSNRIRKVSAGTITTAVGNGSTAVLFDPLDLAFDPRNGDLLIADLSHVKKLSGGILSTVASGLSGPQGITVAANGDIYVAEYLGNVVSRISAGVRTVVAGNGVNGYTGDGGPATSAAVGEPRDVLLDASGDLLI